MGKNSNLYAQIEYTIIKINIIFFLDFSVLRIDCTLYFSGNELEEDDQEFINDVWICDIKPTFS